MTHHDYEAMGGVEGSLARRAEDVFLSLDAEAQAQFDHVMRRITAVVIEEARAFNRRWADYDELTKPPGAKAFRGCILKPGSSPVRNRPDRRRASGGECYPRSFTDPLGAALPLVSR